MAEILISERGNRDLRARERHAGLPERMSLRHGPLEILYDPLEFYVGKRRVGLTPLEGAIVELVVRRGRASSQVVAELFEREKASLASLNVHLHRLRRKFFDAGIANPIETVRGWGLKMRVE